MKLKGKIMLVSVLPILIVGFLLLSSDNKQISEEDMINTAIDYYIENQNDTAVRYYETGGVTIHYKIFADRAEFLEHYPDCCRFYYWDGDGGMPSAFDRWWYSYAGVVSIQAGWRQIDGDEIIEVPFGISKGVYFDTSGNIIHALPKDPRF
jgi:hypothetical protein